MKKIMCIFGTRPEAIKMAPIIKLLENNHTFKTIVCVTGQHQSMLNSVLDLFDITPDYHLNVMTPNQSLSQLTTKILDSLQHVLQIEEPNLVLVHGDTTSTLVGAIAAYYHHIPIAHVEAGLRTNNIELPWPEEANRQLTSVLANIHFAHSNQARMNLLREGIPDHKVFVTGNTVIDALQLALKTLLEPEIIVSLKQQFSFLLPNRPMILVTAHRRESFGEGFSRICEALSLIATRFPNVDIVYPVHLNPEVQKPVKSLLSDYKNIYLLDPVDYLPFVYLMKSSYLILSDSGGIQEEAPALGKPVLIMRTVSERPEGIEAGTSILVGSDVNHILDQVTSLLQDKKRYESMSLIKNPYGDGRASERIVFHIETLLKCTEKKAEQAQQKLSASSL